MNNKNVRLLSLLMLSCVCLLFLTACKADSSKQNIIRLELYNSLPLLMKEEEVTAEQLREADHKAFTDASTLKLVNDRILYDKVSIWKGHIYGKFVFEDNDSSIVKVSRYGSLISPLHSSKVYTFKTDSEKKQWQVMIEDVLGTAKWEQ